MHKTKVISWAAAFGLALLPSVAHADDAATQANGGSDACLNDCMAQCNSSSSATGVQTKKKAIKHAQNGTGTGTSNGVNVNIAPAADSSAAIDAARAEERARAAEEFRAEEQRMNGEHQAELDRVRSEERSAAQARTDSAIAQARSDEQRKIDSARIERERAQKSRGPVIEKALLTPVGVYGAVGGGVGDFTQPSASGATNVGGNWDARLGIGTRSVLGLEADYNGGARDISALGLENQAFLMNNGIEGIARLNVPITVPNTKTLVEPYTFGGVGWQHYDLVDAGNPLGGHPNNTSDVQDTDDIMSVPLGVGLDLGFGGFTLGARATYRQALFNDLLASPTSSFDRTSLNSWETGATLGFEF